MKCDFRPRLEDLYVIRPRFHEMYVVDKLIIDEYSKLVALG
jgi:hypothetical protein